MKYLNVCSAPVKRGEPMNVEVAEPNATRLSAGDTKLFDLRAMHAAGCYQLIIENYHPNFRKCQTLTIDIRSIKTIKQARVHIFKSFSGDIKIFPALEMDDSRQRQKKAKREEDFFELKGTRYILNHELPSGVVEPMRFDTEKSNFVYYPSDKDSIKTNVDCLFKHIYLLLWQGVNESACYRHIALVLDTIGFHDHAIHPKLTKEIGVSGKLLVDYANTQYDYSFCKNAVFSADAHHCYVEYQLALSILQMMIKVGEDRYDLSDLNNQKRPLSLHECEKWFSNLIIGNYVNTHHCVSQSIDEIDYDYSMEARRLLLFALKSIDSLPAGLSRHTPKIDINLVFLLARMKSGGDASSNMKAVISCLNSLSVLDANHCLNLDFIFIHSLYRSSGVIKSHSHNRQSSKDIVNFLCEKKMDSRKLFLLSSEQHAIVVDFYTEAHYAKKIKISNSGFLGWNEHMCLLYHLHKDASDSERGVLNKRCNNMVFDITEHSVTRQAAESFASEFIQAIRTDNFNQIYHFLITAGPVKSSCYVQAVQKSGDCSIESILSHLHDSVLFFESYLKLKAQLLVSAINTIYNISSRDLCHFFIHTQEKELNSDMLKYYRRRCLSGYALCAADMHQIALQISDELFKRLDSCIDRIKTDAERRLMYSDAVV